MRRQAALREYAAPTSAAMHTPKRLERWNQGTMANVGR
jgi:hypothetical protein